MSDSGWYVVQCRANQNYRAQENLENQGFTLLPAPALPKKSARRPACSPPRTPVSRLPLYSAFRTGQRLAHHPLHPGRDQAGCLRRPPGGGAALCDRCPQAPNPGQRQRRPPCATPERPPAHSTQTLYGYGSDIPPFRRSGAHHRGDEHAQQAASPYSDRERNK